MDKQTDCPKPKSQNRQKGQAGERMAVDYLLAKGYSIERVNWKGHRCEIDIIAMHGKTLVFVEVKARKDNSYGWPEKAVNRAKQQHIAKAANHFMSLYQYDSEIRFDIISIVGSGAQADVYHIEDAFVP